MKRCPQCGKQYASEANFCPVDAGRLEDVPDDAPAEGDDHVLGGRFVVGDPIGGGLTGQVFKATDKESGHPCVVKWVDAAVFSSALQMQRTERELKQLERQQAAGIARVLGHGRKDKRLWVASEYVAGTPLHELVANLGALPLERATKIVHDVGVALAEAAKLGVIHRDVAPKNVLVGDGDEVHVINFGVAVPATPSVRGIPEFIAPEQVDGKPVDQRSNIYSLGAMLYTLIVGRPPFQGDAEAVHNAHLHSPPPHASSEANLDSALGTALDRLLDRALAKQSSKRFMTLRQLLAELEKLAGIEPASTQRMTSTTASPPSEGNGASKGKGKGKRKDSGGPQETLLGVPAFERPSQEHALSASASNAPEAASDGVVSEVAQTTSSGVAGLAPPVTQPPPMAGSASFENEPMAIPALAPATAEDPDDAAATNALPVSGQQASEPEPVAPPEPEPVAQPEPVAEPAPVAYPAPVAQDQAQVAQDQAQVAAEPSRLAQAQAEAEAYRAESTAEERHSASRSIASGKRRKKRKKKKATNKFRETMWFKKGELDEAAAEAAAAASGSLVSAKADELPVDERYKDDGTLSAEDQERLSLKTGHTQMMSAMDEKSMGASASHEAISDEELAREMTGGNKRLLLAGALLLLVIVVVIVVVVAGD